MLHLDVRSAASASEMAPERPPNSYRPWMAHCCVAGVLALASILASVVYWPGQLDADTVGLIQEASTGRYTDWHAPVLSALWRILYLLGIRGPGWILLTSILTLLLGFYLVLRVRFSRPVSTIIALICCAFPPVLTMATHVGADAWFTAATISSFGFAARSARTTGRARTVSIAAAVWLAFIATASRHNALPAVLVLFITLAALSSGPIHARPKKTIRVALGLLAALSVFVLDLGVQRAIGTKSTHPEQSTFIYDLAQLSKEEHRVLLPRSIDPKQSLQAIYAGSSPRLIDGLLFSKDPPVVFPVDGPRYNDLRTAWISAVLHHRWGYLKERARLGLWMWSIGHPSYFLYTPPYTFSQYLPRFRSANSYGYRYLVALARRGNTELGDVLYDCWIYGLILIMANVVLARRTRADRVIAALAMAMLFYIVVLQFSAPGEIYRYMYPIVATGTVVTMLLIPRRSHRASASRRGTTTPEATSNQVSSGVLENPSVEQPRLVPSA